MRTNRLYRIRPLGTGKAHIARSTAAGVLPARAVCGTPIRAAHDGVAEFRGAVDPVGDCGRCGRVIIQARARD